VDARATPATPSNQSKPWPRLNIIEHRTSSTTRGTSHELAQAAQPDGGLWTFPGFPVLPSADAIRSKANYINELSINGMLSGAPR
jgi:hypothetical protein